MSSHHSDRLQWFARLWFCCFVFDSGRSLCGRGLRIQYVQTSLGCPWLGAFGICLFLRERPGFSQNRNENHCLRYRKYYARKNRHLFDFHLLHSSSPHLPPLQYYRLSRSTSAPISVLLTAAQSWRFPLPHDQFRLAKSGASTFIPSMVSSSIIKPLAIIRTRLTTSGIQYWEIWLDAVYLQVQMPLRTTITYLASDKQLHNLNSCWHPRSSEREHRLELYLLW